MTRFLAVLLVVLSIGTASATRADDLAEARAHVHRGLELYKERRWKDAMEAFQAAYRLKPHGALHFNVAQCRERLDDGPGALRSFHDYLREIPAAKDRDAVRAAMKRIEEKLAEAHVQVLLLDSSPPGARVHIEGVDRGTTPFHAVLQPGTYAVTLSLPERAPWTEQIVVGETTTAVRDVALGRPPATGGSSSADLAVSPPAAGPGALAAGLPRAPPSGSDRLASAWVAAGVAVVLAAVGAVYGASARSDERAIDALGAPDAAAASAKARSARANARTANLLYGVSAGAAGLTAMLLVLEF